MIITTDWTIAHRGHERPLRNKSRPALTIEAVLVGDGGHAYALYEVTGPGAIRRLAKSRHLRRVLEAAWPHYNRRRGSTWYEETRADVGQRLERDWIELREKLSEERRDDSLQTNDPA